MDFRSATDALGVPHQIIARELGVSVQAIRQARLERERLGYRTPPQGWEDVVRRLLKRRMRECHEALKQIGPE